MDCTVRGNPLPTVDWLAADGGSITNILGIRHVLGNGTIHFPAFEAEAFRQDVHWAIYKCSAVNSVGAVVSRDVTVRAGMSSRAKLAGLVICGLLLSALFSSHPDIVPRPYPSAETSRYRSRRWTISRERRVRVSIRSGGLSRSRLMDSTRLSSWSPADEMKFPSRARLHIVSDRNQ